MELPISVVVPHKTSRSDFFRRFCRPSIEANRPAEILVEENDGARRTGAPWRNAGAARAQAPFLFFCDDDVILAADCLERLLSAIWKSSDPQVRYAYCDFLAVTTPDGARVNEHPVELIRTQDFAVCTLRSGSICSSMALIERTSFCGFDETLQQLDDWDLFLTLSERGVHGVRVPEPLFHAYYLDHGVSNRASVVPAVHAVQRKHGILQGS